MAKTSRETARIGILAVLLIGVIGTIVRAFLVAPTSNTPFIEATFPESVPLEGWNPVPEKFQKLKRDNYLYQYTKNGTILEIIASDRRYDGGNVSRLLFKEMSMPPATISMNIRQKDSIGNYWVFTYENKAYLTACINRAGETTMSDQQYTQNKYKYGWSVGRTFWWIMGQKDFFETACLWSLLSIPVTSDLDKNSLDSTYKTLENAWFEWYRWWKPRLEKLT
ncbi:MAG TPA: cyanoexosortase A system-associated protein [Cyanothece sp. UBA12306]|nr:cyanoexosortase A system-associated protein [Cyanothece sp. UBA12306]